MKYIIVLTDIWGGFEVLVFETKEELLKYLNDNEWELIQTVDWTGLEQYSDTEAKYIAVKNDHIGRTTEAYLRVVKG